MNEIAFEIIADYTKKHNLYLQFVSMNVIEKHYGLLDVYVYELKDNNGNFYECKIKNGSKISTTIGLKDKR